MSLIMEKGNQLLAGSSLSPGEALVSENRWYILYLQPFDGNLVLYRRKNNSKDAISSSDEKFALWSSETYKIVKHPNDTVLKMQTDGNLVIEERTTPIWAIDKYGSDYSGGSLHLQNDGNLVTYKNQNPYWSTNTYSQRDWMDDLDSSKRLTDICVPGTHNSGMYETKFLTSSIVLCQSKTIYEQLMRGVRYFNFRPNDIDGKGIYTRHGTADGPKLQDLLEQMKRFFDEGSNETVYLQFSHFKNWRDGSDARLNDIINKTIGEYKAESYLLSNQLKDVRGKIIFNPSCYDEYANTVEFDNMFNDQKAKFEGYNESKLFMLNWTLTPSVSTSDVVSDITSVVGGVVGWFSSKSNVVDHTNVQHLAAIANSRILDNKTQDTFFEKNSHDKIVNVINVDYYHGGEEFVKICKKVSAILKKELS